jgi:hypothetical protein
VSEELLADAEATARGRTVEVIAVQGAGYCVAALSSWSPCRRRTVTRRPAPHAPLRRRTRTRMSSSEMPSATASATTGSNTSAKNRF